MIDRPDTPHADVLLEGIWEDEVTPDDLASRALSAAQASSYAFRVASEGTTATAQLEEVDASEFLESETGKWAQSFIGIVRVGESLVHVSHALGELARSLQQVNLEQSEIVYQVEAEIEAAQRYSAQAGVDPADRIAELIADARARAADVADKMVTPPRAKAGAKPPIASVSGFMAFGRVPGASVEATERNSRVARNGHARNGYAIRNTRADQAGDSAANGHAGTNGHDSVNGAASAERAIAARKDAAAAAQEAFADSGDDTTMDLGFMAFGRTPASAVPHAGETASAADEAVVDEPVADEAVEDATPVAEPVAEVTEGHADADAPVIANGFLGLGRAPSVSVPADDAAVPVVPQPLVNGFLALGRTPGAGEAAAAQGPSSGPIPVAAPTQFLPLPTTPAEIVAGESGEVLGAEFGAPMTLSGAVDGPVPDREDTRADAMDDGFLSFGRVPGSGWGGSGVLPMVPTTPEVALVTASSHEPVDDEPVADLEGSAEVETTEALDPADVGDDATGEAEDAADERGDDADGPSATDDVDDAASDELDGADDGDLAGDDETADAGVDFADELDAEADELLAPDEQDEDVIAEAGTDLDYLSDEMPAGEGPVDESPSGEPSSGESPTVVDAEDTTDEIAEEEPAVADLTADESAPEEAADAAEPAEPVRILAAAASRPVRKSGPVKFSDLLKAANAAKVEPARMAPAAVVAAAEIPAVASGSEPVADALVNESRASAEAAPPQGVEQADEPEAPAAPAPVLATGPAILGRTEPLVLRKKMSPVVQQVHDAVASILGSLRGGPHGPESGLHWAAGLLVKDAETIMAVTTSDAGWLPPGVVIPAGVRVLWNMPTGYRWAAIDDPVRQLIDYAERDGYTLIAVGTTHPSRAYASVVGEENIVGVHRPGAVLPGGRSRFEATVSPARLQHIRSLGREQAERQARALIRDLETQPIAHENAVGIEAARIDARCFLDEYDEVPPAVLDQLHNDERALHDVLRLDRIPASLEDLAAGTAPTAGRLRDRMLERAILAATLATAYHDIESAVYAWTYARFLASQNEDPPRTT